MSSSRKSINRKIHEGVSAKKVSSKAKTKLPKLEKNKLETRVLNQSLKGVVFLNEQELKPLGIVFGQKDSVFITIKDVLFVCNRVASNTDAQGYLYVIQRSANEDTKQTVTLINQEQANEIGLHEGINRVKVGDDFYKVHYVSYHDLPAEFKSKGKLTTSDQELGLFLSEDHTNDNVYQTLRDFFAQQRQKPLDQEPQEEKVDQLEQMQQKMESEKAYYDLIDLTPELPKDQEQEQAVVATTVHDTENVNDLGTISLTRPNEFEVNFAYEQNFRSINSF